MATRTEIHERVRAADDTQGIRVSWGGVWSGFLVGFGVFLLLSILGLAIGVSAVNVDPNEEANAGGVGVGAIVWSALSLLVSLFIGGVVATRTGLVYDRGAGMIEGVLVWVIAMLAIFWMAGSGIGLLARSTSGLIGGVTQQATGQSPGGEAFNPAELTRGEPAQIADRLNDRETARVVAAASGQPEEQVRQRLSEVSQRVRATDDPERAAQIAQEGLQPYMAAAGQRVERAASEAQPYVAGAVWATLLAMILALMAAIWGAMVGRRQVVHRLREAT